MERFAKGDFDYDKPKLILSEDELQISVEAGKTCSGTLTVQNDGATRLKGVLYSSNRLLSIEEKQFVGIENLIHYKLDATSLEPGEIVDGEIGIITDCGEDVVPFTATVEAPYMQTSLGNIKNLFLLTNLAKTDWEEAVRIFKSEGFAPVFLTSEPYRTRILYDNLIKSRSGNEALEEFLVAIRKKTKVNFRVEKTSYEYAIYNTEKFAEKIVIQKDNWGYGKLQISSDAPFIQFEHKMIWSDNFVGNEYELAILIDPSLMKIGKNSAKIILKSVHQTIELEVLCSLEKPSHKKDVVQKKIKSNINRYTQCYLNFRTNKVSPEQYISETTDIVDSLLALEEDDAYDLLKAHILIVSKREAQGKEMLAMYQTQLEELRISNPILYCGVLYLEALLEKEDEVIHRAYDRIKAVYESGHADLQLLWFLLYLEQGQGRNKGALLGEMKKLFELGNRSPILYYEAATIYQGEPSLLHQLGNFELQVIAFATKYKILEKDLANQFAYLATKEKYYKRIIYRTLAMIYDKYKTKDVLTAICSILIKGHMRSTRYFPWFKLGVEAGIRVTELHEYYMYTIDEDSTEPLPQAILLYFIYNSNLSDKKKAYLYSRIVKEKDKYSSMYQTYQKKIELFATRLLSTRVINPHLAILYDNLIAEGMINEDLVNHLPYIIFRHEVICENSNMKGVYVVHKEMETEEYYPIIDKKAQVNIYTEDALLFFVDNQENRYLDTCEHVRYKLMDSHNYIELCFQYHLLQPTLLIHLIDKIQSFQKLDENTIELSRHILQIEGMKESYYNSIVEALIYYFYDHFDYDMLDYYLSMIQLKFLDKHSRSKILEIMIIRDMYEQVLQGLQKHGYESIAVRHLLKLCVGLIQSTEKLVSDQYLLELAYYIFKQRKYDEIILEYLVEHYTGPIKAMYELWQIAKSFEIKTTKLEEQLLCQMLFAESYIKSPVEVFLSYYNNGNNHTIIRSFLNYWGYRYLMYDRKLDDNLVIVIEREAQIESNDILQLSLIKYYSQKESLSSEEVEFICDQMNSFMKRGLVLPFFLNFKGKIQLPSNLEDKYYAEYRTNPNHKVQIFYMVPESTPEQEYVVEVMRPKILGIYVKEFVLFYNETLQYYITEESDGSENITESIHVKMEKEYEEDDHFYSQMNLMLMAYELQDEETLSQLMENYVKTEYIVNHYFKGL